MICVQRLGAHLRLVARSAFGRVAWRRALPQPMMASGSSSELSSLMGRSFRLEAEIGGPGTESETPGGRSRAHKLSMVETLVALLLASHHGRFCFAVAVLQRARDALRHVARRFSTDVSVQYDVE